MSDYIAPETFNHLVKLAELEMDAEEAEYLRGELNKQLKLPEMRLSLYILDCLMKMM